MGLSRTRLGSRRRIKSAQGRSPARRIVVLPVAAPTPRHDEDGMPVTLLTARDHDCRWPFGNPKDSGFHLCGQHASAFPYCAYHRALAFAGVSKGYAT